MCHFGEVSAEVGSRDPDAARFSGLGTHTDRDPCFPTTSVLAESVLKAAVVVCVENSVVNVPKTVHNSWKVTTMTA